ncbi:MAG: PAS-domain containing protein [Hyphomonadaceae bacterium]|nr:PAS-domain containing protein [Hyphomonadaceae bacterium]
MDGSIAPTLVTAGAAAVAIAALLWALRVTDGARGMIARWKERIAELELKLARADSIFGAHPGAVIIWEDGVDADEAPGAAIDWGKPRAYGSSLALASLIRFSDTSMAADTAVRILQGLSGFEGKDVTGRPARLAPALMRLRREGAPFSITISTPGGVFVEIDGRTAGARAVVWIVDSGVKGVEQGGANGRLEGDPNLAIARDPASFLEMMQHAPFLAWRVTDGGKLDWANDAYLAALETKTLDHAVARNVLIDQAAAEQARRVIDTHEDVEELRHVVIGGTRRALRVVMFPISGGAGGMAFDVTETEGLREDFSRHVAAHDETLNHLAEGVAVFGPDKRLVFHNRAFAAMWKLDGAFLADGPSHAQWLDELKAKRMLPFHGSFAEWRAGELALYQEVSHLPEESWNLEDGRMLRIARQRHPMGGLLLVFSDITSEQTLRGQYNNLEKVQQAALDKLHEGVAVFGADGRMRLANAAFMSMWALDAAEFTTGADFDHIIEACVPLYHDRDVWKAMKARITDPSPTSRREDAGEMRRSDGVIVQFLTRPLPDGATLVAFLDITASRNVENALRERGDALEAADRLKTEFVQNVSVQLRDPLQTITGYADMLASRMAGPLNDRQQAQVDNVVTASSHLTKLIDNVLDLAMIEAGEVALEVSDVDILAVVREAAGSASSAKATEVPIKVQCDKKIGKIAGDGKRIRQILFNLVSNAHRFTERGDTITIGAERLDSMVRFWVTDTGRGMAYEQQATAFDNFKSGDNGGAGLGLALVRSFAELHNGWVSLKSEPGEGTTVSVNLPTAMTLSIAAE